MEDLLSAAEAKIMSEQSIEVLASRKMAEINSKIRAAIEKGEYSIDGNGCLNSAIIDKLRKAGYKVENWDQYNASFWSISWR